MNKEINKLKMWFYRKYPTYKLILRYFSAYEFIFIDYDMVEFRITSESRIVDMSMQMVKKRVFKIPIIRYYYVKYKLIQSMVIIKEKYNERINVQV